METPKRTESRPPRPPVPKFRLIGAGTDTPDFLPPPKSEESSTIALSQDNTSETSSEEHFDVSCFDKKRLHAINDQLAKFSSQLQLGDDVQKCALRILKPEMLNTLKQKRYDAIAIALLIAAVKKCCKPITLKSILAQTEVSEKQIKKILSKLGGQESLDPTVEAFIKEICGQLHLKEKFQQLCFNLLQTLEKQGIIQGEHHNIIAAATVQFIGEIVFAQQGGIKVQIIADHAKCSLYSLRAFLRKLSEQKQRIMKEFLLQP